MIINTKYNLGDMVYQVMTRTEHIKVATNCPVCKDSGFVEMMGNEYICPACNGNTYHIDYGDIEYYTNGNSGRIGKVDVDIYDREYKDHDDYEYMLDATGIGSGTIYKEENLFLSKKEAQEECDVRNKGRYEPSSKYFIEREID